MHYLHVRIARRTVKFKDPGHGLIVGMWNPVNNSDWLPFAGSWVC